MAAPSASTPPTTVVPKPAPEKFKGPVSWLLGPQLIASLKWVALYVAFKGKLDPRDWMQPEVFSFDVKARANTDCPENEFWFDYLSDTADGQKATYSIAYLCLSRLRIEGVIDRGADVKFDSGPIDGTLLPRSELLFIGGDTAYHVADYATLAERFQGPFCWAYEDLKRAGKISDRDQRRPLFAIPANHDYYDVIDGFNRQFRRPNSEEDQPNRFNLYPQLRIPGFKRVQTASYSAIKLPFGWWLWGLDNEVERLDIRQQEFFRRIRDEEFEGRPPNKLIVATPQPTTVLGKLADEKGRLARAFEDLGLEPAFLNDGKLEKKTCRLDLSGDTHHYARYWGPATNAKPVDNGKRGPSFGLKAVSNYASVVSGLGGAFFHPSHVNVGKVKERVLYPSPEDSRRAVAKRLFGPLNLIRGGYVALLGSLIAAVLYFGATVPQSSRVIIDRILYKVFGLAPFPETGLGSWFPSVVWPPATFAQAAELSRWGVILRIGLLALSGALIVVGVVLAKRLVGLTRREKEELAKPYLVWLMAVVGGALVSLFFGVRDFWKYVDSLSPFKCSLLVLMGILWAAASIAAGVIYSEWLFKRARKVPVHKRDYVPAWALVVIGVVILSAGVLKFGTYPFAYLFSDIVFTIVGTGILAGIMLLAVFVGGELRAVLAKILLFGLLGLWHAVLQLGVPFLLVRVGSYWAWIAAPLIALAFGFAGSQLARSRSSLVRALLYGAWLVHGAMLLTLPFILRDDSDLTGNWIGHAARIVVAGLLGMFLSCIWLGWYLAVSLEFNGHYSEAGGAARIEEYKEFIRIKLTPESLTAYVIGVDKPLAEGADLEMKLVDVFELRPS